MLTYSLKYALFISVFGTNFSFRDIDQRVIYAIETIVIDWAKQIHKVLKLDSGSPLLKEKNANPLVEIKFWKAKEWKLKNIYKQV